MWHAPVLQPAFRAGLKKVSQLKDEPDPLESIDFRSLLHKSEKPQLASKGSVEQQDFRSLLKSSSPTKDNSDAGAFKYQKPDQKDFREVLSKKDPTQPKTHSTLMKEETKVFKERRISQQPKILSEADLHDLQVCFSLLVSPLVPLRLL
jgi:hypothetical protein